MAAADPRWPRSGLIQQPIRLLGFFGAGTAGKIFLVFVLTLLPLGVIAVLGVLQAIRTSDQEREALIRLSVEQHANRLSRAIMPGRRALYVVMQGYADKPDMSCEEATEVLAQRGQPDLQFVIYDRQGRIVCASPQAPPPVPPAQRFKGELMTLMPKQGRLISRNVSSDAKLVGIGSYDVATIRKVLGVDAVDRSRLVMTDDSAALTITSGPGGLSGRPVSASATIDLGLTLTETMEIEPLSMGRLFTLFMPLFFWLLAAGLAWYCVHRLLVAPLIRLQRALALYRPGDRPAPIDMRSHVLEEINVLSATFLAMAEDVASHEQQMLHSIEQQRRLTREVHHRVKNNLQIIASLVSLHSRSARGEEATEAYASIQRRVDALAVVHRNHFAEIEHNEGINGSSLLNELAASLRGSAGDHGNWFMLRVDCDQLMLDQDVAVPVAFLVTELVELAMRIDPRATVQIALKRDPAPGEAKRAILSIQSATFVASSRLDALLEEGFGRVLVGLSRQLRTVLEWDGGTGRYAISVSVLNAGAAA